MTVATPVLAMDEEMFAQNGIVWYDPDSTAGDCQSSSLDSPGSGGGPVSGSDRLKNAVIQYGQTAMDMQKEWGTPWEVVFAQMQKESSVGTAGVAVNGATNNWLGITGTGDAGSYQSGSHTFAVYSSVDASVRDWSGTRVLRNGRYDAAFAHLDPNNYNLGSFLEAMIAVYAPSSDGNDVGKYVEDVKSFIDGPIREARESMGWPSSAELAQQNNIGIGGNHPLGSSGESSGDGAQSTPANCTPSAGSGDINQTAISLSWPDRSHANNDPKPEYREALNAPNGVATRREGDSCSIGGNSCDAFVATVMRFSGADPDFPCCTAAAQLSYLGNNPGKYTDITASVSSSADLLPGDIRSRAGHIEIYVVLEDGTGRIASASHCDRTGDHGIGYYPNSEYRVFRKN
jgi:hypothetical protein